MGTHPIFESDFDCLTEGVAMVKKEARCTELDRPWGEVVQAVYQKYPNPHNEAARVSDILDRYVEDGKLVTVRYSGSKFPVPDIINSTFYRFTGIRFPELAYSYEYSILDLQDKSLKQYSRNTTMSSFLNFTELIEYRAAGEGVTSQMKQQWHVQTMINSWIDGWFEGQFLGICRKNAEKGINGVNWVADLRNGDEIAVQKLADFRNQLKIIVDDIGEMSDKVVQTTGEISKKVAEICTETVEDVEQTTGEISKKVAEMYSETVENVEQTTEELTKKVTELYNETADNVEEVVGETTKRLRHFSEPSSGSRR